MLLALVLDTQIDRGSLAKIISFRGTHVGNTWFMVYLKDIQVYCYQKSSQAKNLPDTEKTGDFLLSSIKLYYSKKIRNFEFNNNENDLHHEKEHKKLHLRHLNSFFISQMVFELYIVKHPFLS